jgi:hypothetical protein
LTNDRRGKIKIKQSIDCSLGQEGYKKPENPNNKKTTPTRRSQLNTIPGKGETDNVAKESLDENLEKTEEYPPQGLANRITKQHEEQQQRKWEQTDSKIRNRKQQKTRRNVTSVMKSEMKTRRQVIT